VRVQTLAPGTGALVSEVLPDSPASQAGIQPGDIIQRVAAVEIGGNDPEATIRFALSELPQGGTLMVLAERNRGKIELPVTLGPRKVDNPVKALAFLADVLPFFESGSFALTVEGDGTLSGELLLRRKR